MFFVCLFFFKEKSYLSPMPSRSSFIFSNSNFVLFFFSFPCFRINIGCKKRFELRGSVYEKKVRVTFENGMLIEYTFIGDDRQMHPLESTFRSKTFWTMANVSADVVITNLGVFHLTDLEYYANS